MCLRESCFTWLVVFTVFLPRSLEATAQQTDAPSSTSSTDDRPAESQPVRPSGQHWYMGRQVARTMSADGASWLVRNSRKKEEQPQKLLDALEIQPAQTVCDFGCGNGYYTLQLAQRVGPLGKVVAVDIQQEMLDLLRERAQPRGLHNIQAILASPTDSKLPQGELDLVLMVDVYHELTNPGEILAAVYRSLRPGGRLAMVEFREEDPEVPILPLHKMSQAQVMKEITANGFKLVGQCDDLPWQHVLFFARDDSFLPVAPLNPWSPVVSSEAVLRKLPLKSSSKDAAGNGQKTP